MSDGRHLNTRSFLNTVVYGARGLNFPDILVGCAHSDSLILAVRLVHSRLRCDRRGTTDALTSYTTTLVILIKRLFHYFEIFLDNIIIVTFIIKVSKQLL